MERRRMLLFATGFVMLLFGMQIGGLQSVLRRISELYALNNIQMSMIISAQHCTTIVAPLFGGYLSDRFGKRSVLVMAQMVYTLGCLMVWLSVKYTQVLIGIVVLGAGYSVNMAVSSAAVADVFPSSGAKIQNLTQCIFGLAAFAGPWIFLYEGISWKWVFILAGAGSLVAVVLFLMTKLPRSAVAEKSSEQSQDHNSYGTVALLGICMLIAVGIENTATGFTGLLFEANGGDVNAAGYALSAFWIVVTVVRFIFSRIWVERIRLVRRMFVLTACALILIATLPVPRAYLVLFALLGAGVASLGPTLVSTAASCRRNQSGMMASILISIGGVGSVILPFVAGILSEHFNLNCVFVLLGILSIAAWLILSLINPSFAASAQEQKK